ncbi:hypothetical protein M153_394000923 [Pseudoloma neurophilia]|uniref:Uncharacterized protein n=1 Tax=Pseudoloma neurophilia TaxID=146866 RepID=A0A0R0M3P9_9MICR|nr:hypothetical protein M153_394000923 [Pseudoloma neurophilia]
MLIDLIDKTINELLEKLPTENKHLEMEDLRKKVTDPELLNIINGENVEKAEKMENKIFETVCLMNTVDSQEECHNLEAALAKLQQKTKFEIKSLQ